MGQPSFFDNVREYIGGVAFAIYLWAARMTKEEFWAAQERQAVEHHVQRTLGNKAHMGDPCIYCGVAHDDVSVGDCPSR